MPTNSSDRVRARISGFSALACIPLAFAACGHSGHSRSAPTQPQPSTPLFGEAVGKTPFAVVPVGGATQVEWVDLDGDGRRDLITLAGGLRVFKADARGALVEQTGLLATSETLTGFAVGDVDGDGRLDLVAGIAGNGRIKLLRADGNGAFQDASARVPVTASTQPLVLALADLDGNGKLDILVARSGSATELYLNDGQGGFAEVSRARLPRAVLQSGSLAIGDVDGDGDRDVVIGGGFQQPVQLWLNDGQGFFTDVTSPNLPPPDAGMAQVELRDMDGDGDLDLLIGSSTRNSGNALFNLLYRNDGHGVFSREPSTIGLPAMAVGDVDRDGDADVVGVDQDAVLRLLRNGGAGNFTDEGHALLPDLLPTVLRLVDVDGDGAADLTAATLDATRVFLSNGRGRFRLPDAGPALPWPQSTVATSTVVSGDIDGDGDMDLLFGGDAVRVFLNDGTARFTDASATLLPPGLSGGVLAADVDGDGAVDLIAGDVVVHNDGRRRFSIMGTLQVLPDSVGVAGDVNGDGAVDLVFAQPGQRAVLLLNDGRGAFRDASTQMPERVAAGVLLFDADADGDLDVFLRNALGPVDRVHALLINDGAGTFTDHSERLPADAFFLNAVAVGDIDGNGRNDIVLARDTSATPIPVPVRALLQVVLDRGDQGYAPPSYLEVDLGRGVSRIISALALTDVDGDGRPDIVAVTQNVLPSDGIAADCGELLVARNTGAGSFGPLTIVTSFGSICAGNGAARAVLVADLDEDGDADLVTAHRLTHEGNPRSCRNGMLLNLTRHLVAPGPPFVGNQYTIRAFAQPGLLAADAVALPFLSVRRLRVPTPNGVFQLDPTLLINLRPVVIPKTSGSAPIVVDVPRDTALQGGTLFVQALIATADGNGRFTNFIADVVP